MNINVIRAVSSALLITRKQTPFLQRWTQTRDDKSGSPAWVFPNRPSMLLCLKSRLSGSFPKVRSLQIMLETGDCYKEHPQTSQPFFQWELTVNLGFWLVRQVTDTQSQIQSRNFLLSLWCPPGNGMSHKVGFLTQESPIRPRLLLIYDPPASVSWVQLLVFRHMLQCLTNRVLAKS